MGLSSLRKSLENIRLRRGTRAEGECREGISGQRDRLAATKTGECVWLGPEWSPLSYGTSNSPSEEGHREEMVNQVMGEWVA